MRNFRQPKSESISAYDPKLIKIAPDISTPARQVSVVIENEIRNNSLETGAFISQAGEVLLRREGRVDSVGFSPKELYQMQGAIFTHNHPNGSSFSFQGVESDVGMAIIWELGELRVVTEKFRHILSPKNGKWATIDRLEQGYFAAQNHADLLVNDMVKSDQLDYASRHAEKIYQALLILSRQLEMIYRREKS